MRAASSTGQWEARRRRRGRLDLGWKRSILVCGLVAVAIVNPSYYSARSSVPAISNQEPSPRSPQPETASEPRRIHLEILGAVRVPPIVTRAWVTLEAGLDEDSLQDAVRRQILDLYRWLGFGSARVTRIAIADASTDLIEVGLDEGTVTRVRGRPFRSLEEARQYYEDRIREAGKLAEGPELYLGICDSYLLDPRRPFVRRSIELYEGFPQLFADHSLGDEAAFKIVVANARLLPSAADASQREGVRTVALRFQAQWPDSRFAAAAGRLAELLRESERE